ncbi:Putative activity regulator of membrane protease YbbK [plant metagenome]|uniref:Activity regulator of membrane protease YbbK n=1 Tax=plant metagenome TaxID=1297885 RepID=A0A484S3S7_9ZZZZ
MWYWFGLAALALIGEVASGTFYLLLVALGLAGAGLAAWAGVAFGWQLLVCALVALSGLFVLRRTGVLKKREVDAGRNADVNLDVGQVVEVDAWSADRTTRVWYRGAHWDAALQGGAAAAAGTHRIVALQGARLVLAPVTPAPAGTP